MKLTSAHWSNKQIDIISLSVDFVWYLFFPKYVNTGIHTQSFRNETSHHWCFSHLREPIKHNTNHSYIQIDTTFGLCTTPNRKSGHSNETPATGYTGSCQNDTSQCSQQDMGVPIVSILEKIGHVIIAGLMGWFNRSHKIWLCCALLCCG